MTSIRTRSFVVSAAELATIHSTPVVLVKAPGANRLIVPVRVIVQYIKGSVAYNTSKNLGVTFSDYASAIAGLTTAFDGANSSLNTAEAGDGQVINHSLSNANTALSLVADAALGSGDGIVKVYVEYFLFKLVV